MWGSQDHGWLLLLGRGRPAAYTFKNTETGYADEMCKEHSDALDARNQRKFIELDGPTLDPSKARLKQDLADAYSRHKLEGHRIPQRTIDGASLADGQMEEMARRREQLQARKWEQTIEPDPWVR
jgi:hypothetical protein